MDFKLDNSIIWHYSVINEFFKDKYSNILEWQHFTKKKQIKVCVGKDSKGSNEYVEISGWVCPINKENIFLPLEIGNTDIRELLPLKITKTETLYAQSEAYEKPTVDGIVSFKIPAKKQMEFKVWVDNFYKVPHTNQDDFKLYKLIVLGSYLIKLNWRVSTNGGFGKNGVVDILKFLLKDVKCYTPDTPAKFKKETESSLLVLDEFQDLPKKKKKLLEKEIRIAGDGRISLTNSSLGSAHHGTKDVYDTSNLSVGFTYNNIEYYQEPAVKEDISDEYFDNLFTPATRQRYLPFKLDGEVDVRVFDEDNFGENSPLDIYNSNKDFFRDWVMSALYFKSNFYTLLEGKSGWVWQNEEVIGNITGRLNHHFSSLKQIFKAYSENETEYNSLCDLAINKYWDYLNMLGVYRPVSILDCVDKPVYYNSNMIGLLSQGNFIMNLSIKDYLKKYQGFGILEDTLYYLKKLKINDIYIHFKGKCNKIVYKVSLLDYFESEFIENTLSTKKKFVKVKDMSIISKTPISNDKSLKV